MELYYKSFGNGEPLIILHGLFGFSDNWFSLGKRFAENHTVFLVDLRNHGRSPHSGEMDYGLMAEDLEAFMEQHFLSSCALLGHSMGGKVAMQTALFSPELVEKLVVIDMAPRAYAGGHEPLFRAMMSLRVEDYFRRRDVEEALSDQIKDPSHTPIPV